MKNQVEARKEYRSRSHQAKRAGSPLAEEAGPTWRQEEVWAQSPKHVCCCNQTGAPGRAELLGGSTSTGSWVPFPASLPITQQGLERQAEARGLTALHQNTP